MEKNKKKRKFSRFSIVCLLASILVVFGIRFALKGINMVNGQTDNFFTSISNLERQFKTMGKTHISRWILYINLSTDNLHVSHSEQKLILEIKHILLNIFAEVEVSFIAPYDDANYIVLTNSNAVVIREQIESCLNDINRILLKYSALNMTWRFMVLVF